MPADRIINLMNIEDVGYGAFALWVLNVLLVLSIYISNRYGKPAFVFWSPAMFMCMIYLYYVITGPLVTVLFGSTLDRGTDMAEYYGMGWLGSFFCLFFWYIGYLVFGRRAEVAAHLRKGPKLINSSRLFLFGNGFCILGVGLFFLARGSEAIAMVNPFRSGEFDEYGQGGAFANYFLLSLNFIIPGCVAIFLSKKGARSWGALVFWVIIALGLFASLGFRYRIIMLGFSLLIAFCVYHKKRLNLLLGVGVGIVLILLMGQIGATRSYGSGLSMDKKVGAWDAVMGGFSETTIFGTSGAVLSIIPEARPYVGMEPITQALLMPMPAALFPGKNSDHYLIDIISAVYGPRNYGGAAYMFYAEWFMAFGWLGLAIASFLLGLVFGCLWRWYCKRRFQVEALFVYSVLLPLLYVLMSRGFLPGVFIVVSFTTLPVLFIYWFARGEQR